MDEGDRHRLLMVPSSFALFYPNPLSTARSSRYIASTAMWQSNVPMRELCNIARLLPSSPVLHNSDRKLLTQPLPIPHIFDAVSQSSSAVRIVDRFIINRASDRTRPDEHWVPGGCIQFRNADGIAVTTSCPARRGRCILVVYLPTHSSVRRTGFVWPLHSLPVLGVCRIDGIGAG
ncbi:hypothetical protein BV25DRAFT_1088563 [Artomyces pyxidatus]|uniref:Uncharacterized protein n=1 Tax=Artomyces pyxidatus TaxID=48021 RepID=A0ACB8TFV9_9AGAM|nr:hypothetical protein BV25DRAFT_1088563 [Artomyces pyxidatus]